MEKIRHAMSIYLRSHLLQLESEAIFVIREVAAQFERPVLLFSGGKDSIVMAHLARRAFWPGKIPFPLMHIDTGHNFPETLDFRDWLMEQLDAQLIVRYVQDSIDQGRAVEETGPQRQPQRAANRHAARCPRRVQVRGRAGRRAPRRGESARQRTLLLAPRQLWTMGPQESAA